MLKKEKTSFSLTETLCVATQGYVGESPSEITVQGVTRRVRSEIRDNADLGLFLVVWAVT